MKHSDGEGARAKGLPGLVYFKLNSIGLRTNPTNWQLFSKDIYFIHSFLRKSGRQIHLHTAGFIKKRNIFGFWYIAYFFWHVFKPVAKIIIIKFLLLWPVSKDRAFGHTSNWNLERKCFQSWRSLAGHRGSSGQFCSYLMIKHTCQGQARRPQSWATNRQALLYVPGRS